MTALQFGRQMRQKLAAAPGTLSLANPSMPQGTTTTSGSQIPPPPPPPPKPPTMTPNPNDGAVRGGKAPGYTDVLDRWYNPWTKQQVTERGETGLMRAGQVAMGTGAIAGTAAAGLAAAPTIAGMASGGTAGTTAAGAATGGAAASQTPAGQNAMQRIGDMAQRGTQMAGQAADFYQRTVDPALKRVNYKPEDVLQDVYAAGTGHFDKIKGPGWGFKTPSSFPGAPSFPKPIEAWKNMYSAGAGMLPSFATATPAKVM